MTVTKHVFIYTRNDYRVRHLFSILCKSHALDIHRIVKLTESIEKYNQDKIPFYICCPNKDLTLFKEHLRPFRVEFISDEEVIEKTLRADNCNQNDFNDFPGHLMQQVIKAEFWRMNICDNYLIIDSDSYFIRPFFIRDFLYKKIPYTVMHEAKDLLSFAARNGKKNICKDYRKIRKKFQQIFKRNGKNFDFGPTPVIWSAKVWQELYENYAIANNTNIIKMIQTFPCELLWYGESLLHSNAIPLIPIEALFKVYHYKDQFKEGKTLGENDKILAQNYFGVVIQSNWERSLDQYPDKKKNMFKKLVDYLF